MLDFFCKDLMFLVKLELVKIDDSVDTVDWLSSSELPFDFVGEGGKGTLEGVRLIQFMVSESFLGEDGGVKSKSERGCSSWGILLCAR